MIVYDLNDNLWQLWLHTEPDTFTDSKVNDCFEKIFQAEQQEGQKRTYQTSMTEWQAVPR